VSRRSAAILLLALAAAACTPAPEPAAPPRLIAFLVVDQLRYDYLERFADLYEGGFKTLLDRGALFTNARYRHGLTLTGPGHASMATGLHPSHTGITGNDWYDPELRKKVNCVDDASASTVGGPGRAASSKALLADTLGDRLKAKYSGSRVVGLSMKDRGAILFAGRSGDGAYWYSVECGCFVTSSQYMDEAPAWLTEFNEAKPSDHFGAKPWERLIDNPALYEKHSRVDDFKPEMDGVRTTFPHEWRSQPPDESFHTDLSESGLADELLLDAALAAFKGHQLGADAEPDLLAISFSGTDKVGHDYGPFSQEAMDQHLRLDRLLGRLFAEIEKSVGMENAIIVLTADHGSAPVVEFAIEQGRPAKRIPKTALPDAVNQAFAARDAKIGEVIALFDPPHIYLDKPLLQSKNIPWEEAEAITHKALLDTGYVAGVYTATAMQAQPPAGDPFWALYRNSFHEPRSPHFMVRLAEYYYVDDSQGATGHGSPYDYDRHVPIIFMGGGVKMARHEKDCGPEDIAPTLGKMAGVEMPLEADTRLLDELSR
jgi:predicted AlkP superfamily pyrophosphatase or phosphodiesterase